MNGEMLDGDDSDLSDLARKCLRQPSRKLLLELGKRLRKSGKLQIVTALLGRKTGITADERLLADTNLWLSGAISSVKSKICDDFEYCAKKKQYPIDRLVELATVIAALVADIVGSAPSGVLLAVIVIRQGLDKLCGCDTATYYVDCALKEEEGSLKARQLLERAAEEYPYSMCALYNLGLEYHRINDHSRAEQCYRSALLIDPEHTYALHNLSHLLLSLNRETKEARDLAARAFELSPDTPETAYTYGWSLLVTGQPKKALRYLEAAAKKDPTQEHLDRLAEAKDAVARQQMHCRSE